MDGKVSIVEYFGEQVSNHCGYCKSEERDKYSHGMWCHTLTVQDYQDLLDRGWRRSGKYTYKPTMNRTCCPMYTIRCNALEFVPSKSQRKTARKFVNFLKSGEKCKQWIHAEQTTDCSTSAKHTAAPANSANVVLEPQETNSTSTVIPKKSISSQDNPKNATKKVNLLEKSVIKGADPSKPKCTKKKHQRRERWRQKLIEKGIKPEEIDMYRKKPPVVQSVEELLSLEHVGTDTAHKFEIRLVRSHPASEAYKTSLDESYKIYWKYQTIIHKDPPDKPSLQQFQRFLCHSPLHLENGPRGHPGFGSFHQHYILDGKIIAVGVIDILAHSVSSKYFYYDPDYQFLNLGVYSALNEIAFVRGLAKLTPAVKYYYMGYYIHTCQKMRYKGCYSPSYLLCPEAYTWHPIKECIPKLDENKYSKFNDDNSNVDAVDVAGVLVLHNRTLMTYEIYKQVKHATESDDDDVKEYANLIGPPASRSLLLYKE